MVHNGKKTAELYQMDRLKEHGVMFFTLAGAVKAVLIIAFTGAIAWFMGYVNEKCANGSIIPSWIIHTVSNLFSGICAAFLII